MQEFRAFIAGFGIFSGEEIDNFVATRRDVGRFAAICYVLDVVKDRTTEDIAE